VKKSLKKFVNYWGDRATRVVTDAKKREQQGGSRGDRQRDGQRGRAAGRAAGCPSMDASPRFASVVNSF